MTRGHASVLVTALITLSVWAGGQAGVKGQGNARQLEKGPFPASVYSDPGMPPITVTSLELSFPESRTFVAVWVPSPPPPVLVPLVSGETIPFRNISEIVFSPTRVERKEFIPFDKRRDKTDVDTAGYRHWSAVEVEAVVTGLQGGRVKGQVERSEFDNVVLTGKTELGDFRLCLNREGIPPVKVVFHHYSVLVCPKDAKHVYSNPDWKFCPIDGLALTPASGQPSSRVQAHQIVKAWQLTIDRGLGLMVQGETPGSVGHITGTVSQANPTERSIAINPDDDSTIVRCDGMKWSFFHLAEAKNPQFRFCVSPDSSIDWPRLSPGTRVSFDCKEKADFSFDLTSISYP